MIFKVIIVVLLIWLCLLLRTTNQNLVYVYGELVEIRKTGDAIFNRVKHIEEELDEGNN
jgi:hypothetical protein